MLVCALVLSTFSAAAQSFVDQGLAGGSSIALLQTTSVSPSSHMRVHYSRTMFNRKARNIENLIDLTAGLSPNLEMYAKVTVEQAALPVNNTQFGLGGKFLLPFQLPLINHGALWCESVSSIQTGDGSAGESMLRTGFIANPGNGNMSATVLTGVTRAEGKVGFLGGVGVGLPLHEAVKMGAEVLYGYLERGSVLGSMSIMIRPLAHVGVQVSPGYLRSGETSGWYLSVGISCSTADINFFPATVNEPTDALPSFEEIEKQLNEGKKE